MSKVNWMEIRRLVEAQRNLEMQDVLDGQGERLREAIVAEARRDPKKWEEAESELWSDYAIHRQIAGLVSRGSVRLRNRFSHLIERDPPSEEQIARRVLGANRIHAIEISLRREESRRLEEIRKKYGEILVGLELSGPERAAEKLRSLGFDV